MKLLPLLAALPLLCASVVSANSLMSVGYFNGGGDVTAGPGGDIDKLDVRQITHLNYSFGLVYNDEKDETNAALKDPSKLHQIWLSFRRRLGSARILRRGGDEGNPGGVYSVRSGDY